MKAAGPTRLAGAPVRDSGDRSGIIDLWLGVRGLAGRPCMSSDGRGNISSILGTRPITRIRDDRAPTYPVIPPYRSTYRITAVS